MKFITRLFTWWHGQTLGTQLFTWRKGEKVGEDEDGNIYYQCKAGKRRWVIFAGEVEATKISPDWHGWLHHTFDDRPGDNPLVRKPWQKPHMINKTGTPDAYVPSGSLRAAKPKSTSDYDAWQPE